MTFYTPPFFEPDCPSPLDALREENLKPWELQGRAIFCTALMGHCLERGLLGEAARFEFLSSLCRDELERREVRHVT
jgi:hypothetical protein